MSILTTIQSTDLITNSRSDINDNFSALNTDKMETSVLDTDTTLAADSDSKVPTQKAVKAYVDANLTAPITSEVTIGTTHSLTTTASQRVLVIAKGGLITSSLGGDPALSVTLKYNTVQKDVVRINQDTDGNSDITPFCLTYTETPGAATQNVTVETTGGTLENVVITVLKIRI